MPENWFGVQEVEKADRKDFFRASGQTSEAVLGGVVVRQVRR